MSWKVAVGSRDGYAIDQHFGRCDRFLIYEIDDSFDWSQIGIRENEHHASPQGHQENQLRASADYLEDCSFVLVSRIGAGARAVLYDKGIHALAVHAPIEDALDRLVQFLRSGREFILQ